MEYFTNFALITFKENKYLKTLFVDKVSYVNTPEMGLIFEDEIESLQWGMVGYFDTDISFPNTSIFDLHLITSLNGGECSPLSREIIKDERFDDKVDVINVPAYETSYELVIQKLDMNLDDSNCE